MLMNNCIMLCYVGGVAESRHTDHTFHTDSRCDEKRSDGGNAHGPQGVEVTYQKRAAVRPRVLYVPDKHGPHEESNRVSRRSW